MLALSKREDVLSRLRLMPPPISSGKAAWLVVKHGRPGDIRSRRRIGSRKPSDTQPPESQTDQLSARVDEYRTAVDILRLVPQSRRWKPQWRVAASSTDGLRVHDVLLLRDEIGRQLTAPGQRRAEDAASLALVDQKLKAQTAAIQDLVGYSELGSWRESRAPRSDDWWWYLDRSVNPRRLAIATGVVALVVSAILAIMVTSRSLGAVTTSLGGLISITATVFTSLAGSTTTTAGSRLIQSGLDFIRLRRALQPYGRLALAVLALFGSYGLYVGLPPLGTLLTNCQTLKLGYDVTDVRNPPTEVPTPVPSPTSSPDAPPQLAKPLPLPGLCRPLDSIGMLSPTFGVEAEKAYSLAIELNPDLHVAYHMLGFTLERRLLYDRAMQSYQDAINRRPDFLLAYNNLGRLFILQRHDAPSALRLLITARDLAEPKDSSLTMANANVRYVIHKNLAWAKYELKLYGEARKDINLAIAQMPQRAGAYCLKGLVDLAEHPEQPNRPAWIACLSNAPDSRNAERIEDSWLATAQEKVR